MGRFWLLAVLSCGACAPLSHGEDWVRDLFAHSVPQTQDEGTGGWDALGALQPGQSGATPSGAMAQVKDSWLSALGSPCKRLALAASHATALICQSRTGWYELRDVSAEENDDAH